MKSQTHIDAEGVVAMSGGSMKGLRKAICLALLKVTNDPGAEFEKAKQEHPDLLKLVTKAMLLGAIESLDALGFPRGLLEKLFLRVMASEKPLDLMQQYADQVLPEDTEENAPTTSSVN